MYTRYAYASERVYSLSVWTEHDERKIYIIVAFFMSNRNRRKVVLIKGIKG